METLTDAVVMFCLVFFGLGLFGFFAELTQKVVSYLLTSWRTW